jgi:GTP-binding protein HflX
LTPTSKENIGLDELKATWMSKLEDNCIFISATKKINIENLRTLLYEKVKAIHIERYPYNDFLFQKFDDLTTLS